MGQDPGEKTKKQVLGADLHHLDVREPRQAQKVWPEKGTETLIFFGRLPLGWISLTYLTQGFFV